MDSMRLLRSSTSRSTRTIRRGLCGHAGEGGFQSVDSARHPRPHSVIDRPCGGSSSIRPTATWCTRAPTARRLEHGRRHHLAHVGSPRVGVVVTSLALSGGRLSSGHGHRWRVGQRDDGATWKNTDVADGLTLGLTVDRGQRSISGRASGHVRACRRRVIIAGERHGGSGAERMAWMRLEGLQLEAGTPS